MTQQTSHGPRYRQLPLWCDATRFLVEVEDAVRRFPRYHKYTLGSELRRQAMDLSRRVARAAQCTDAARRAGQVEQLVWQVEDIKITLQLAKEVEAFASFSQFQRLAEQTVALGKQSGGGGKRHGQQFMRLPVREGQEREPTSLCAHAAGAPWQINSSSRRRGLGRAYVNEEALASQRLQRHGKAPTSWRLRRCPKFGRRWLASA